MLPALALAAVLGSALAGCRPVAQPTTLRGEGLGASWSVKLAGSAPRDADLLDREIQSLVDDVARHLSRWQPDSSLNRLNAAQTDDWLEIPPGLAEPLAHALALAADTGGAFDPTVGPLVDVWGFGAEGRKFEPPTADAVSAARARVGYGAVTLDTGRNRIRRPAGMRLDLSSMTHGFAADRIANHLNAIGVQHYLIDVGGEIRARGRPRNGSSWHVTIEQPPTAHATEPPSVSSDRAAAPPRIVALDDAGIATSGNYRYYFDFNGRRYAHRIDPRTGEPVSHALTSVTVIAAECMHADALATALTVLGPDEGYRYATERDIAALFVTRTDDGVSERMTPRFAQYLN